MEQPDRAPLSSATLEAGLSHVLEAPSDRGRLELIVRRPGVDRREVVDRGQLDTSEGLVGDNWRQRGSRSTADGSADVERQLTLMGARVADLVAGDRKRWALAGDQLYVDVDLSVANLPAGTRLQIGHAVIEITDAPHLGCRKFASRFGEDALRFVNSPEGRFRRFRGVNCRVLTAGEIAVGDVIAKVEAPVPTG